MKKSNMKNPLKECPICKVLFVGHGNNCFPLNYLGSCCDECNMNYVIPKRISILLSTIQNKK